MFGVDGRLTEGSLMDGLEMLGVDGRLLEGRLEGSLIDGARDERPEDDGNRTLGLLPPLLEPSPRANALPEARSVDRATVTRSICVRFMADSVSSMAA
jgi:hypothetical protein